MSKFSRFAWFWALLSPVYFFAFFYKLRDIDRLDQIQTSREGDSII